MIKIVPVTEEYLAEKQIPESSKDLNVVPAMKERIPGASSVMKSHFRTYINLHGYYINPVTVTQSEVKRLLDFGNYDTDYIGSILDYSKAIDLTTEELIDSSDVKDLETQRTGGEAIKYFIENTDFVKRLFMFIKGSLKDSGITDIEVDNTNFTQLFGRIYVDGALDKIDRVREKCLGSKTICRLYNMLSDFDFDNEKVAEYLKSIMLITKIVVPPVSLRPSTERQKNSTTEVYNTLQSTVGIIQSSKLKSKGSVAQTIITYRKDIQKDIRELLTATTHDTTDRRYHNTKSHRSIYEKLGHKKGHIRQNMLSKRQDYSGRAVVTINPSLPTNTIKIPKGMLVKMFQYHAIANGLFTADDFRTRFGVEFTDEVISALKSSGILDKVPVAMGRNPTLHKHGIQGFKVEVSKNNAIEVPPLPCPAFNMDFDGDQSHVEIPMLDSSIDEISELIATDRNIFLAKTAKCTLNPRMDMVYGLYQATKKHEGMPVSTYSCADGTELIKKLSNLDIYVWDNVTVAGVGTGQAGRIALLSLIPKAYREYLPEEPVTAGIIEDLVDVMCEMTSKVFVRVIDEIARLGFRLSSLYSKSVSVVDPFDRSSIKESFNTFHIDMKQIDEFNYYGMYSANSYGHEFDVKYKKVEDDINKKILNIVPQDSMYLDMAQSGARGGKSNLIQIYASKGRISKNDSESFNTIIEEGLVDGLTGLEHMIAAFGSRKGQISKSIKTADAGYMSRMLWHVAGNTIITEEDCGTTEGIEISVDYIKKYLVSNTADAAEKEAAESKAKKIFKDFVKNRYKTDGTLVSKSDIESYSPIKIRTPLKCKNPCCAKCYGINPGTRRKAVYGFPVGIQAAHALGETLTQLTMKLFQRGGVAGSGVSPYERVDAILSLTNFKSKAEKESYVTFSPIAWGDGELKVEPASKGQVSLYIEGTKGSAIKVSEYNEYKANQKVKKGDILTEQIMEIYTEDSIKYSGMDETLMRMLHNLYIVYSSEVKVLPVHFELILSSMMRYYPRKVIDPRIKYGLPYSKIQLKRMGYDFNDRELFEERIDSIKSSCYISPDFLEGLCMERVGENLRLALYNRLTDSTDSIVVQLALGLLVQVGTGVNDNFIKQMKGEL